MQIKMTRTWCAFRRAENIIQKLNTAVFKGEQKTACKYIYENNINI